MRANTLVCIRLESVGRPDHTIEHQMIRVDVAIRSIAGWLLETSMGHKIRIVIARSAEELADRRSAAKGELMDELESLLAGQEDDSGHSEE